MVIYIDAWLHFDGDRNPFLIPQEALDESFLMESGSLLVFGERPTKELQKKLKLPRTVREITLFDADRKRCDIIPSNSALSKFKAAQKAARSNNNQEPDEVKAGEIENDPFQTFISYDTLKRIQKVWRVVNGVYASAILESDKTRSISLEGSVSIDGNLNIDAEVVQAISLTDGSGNVNAMGDSISLGNNLSLRK